MFGQGNLTVSTCKIRFPSPPANAFEGTKRSAGWPFMSGVSFETSASFVSFTNSPTIPEKSLRFDRYKQKTEKRRNPFVYMLGNVPARVGRSVCVFRVRNVLRRSVCPLYYFEKSVRNRWNRCSRLIPRLLIAVAYGCCSSRIHGTARRTVRNRRTNITFRFPSPVIICAYTYKTASPFEFIVKDLNLLCILMRFWQMCFLYT